MRILILLWALLALASPVSAKVTGEFSDSDGTRFVVERENGGGATFRFFERNGHSNIVMLSKPDHDRFESVYRQAVLDAIKYGYVNVEVTEAGGVKFWLKANYVPAVGSVRMHFISLSQYDKNYTDFDVSVYQRAFDRGQEDPYWQRVRAFESAIRPR